MQIGHLFKKSDIYSFGVLLYSMLNGYFKEGPSGYHDAQANDLIDKCLDANIAKRLSASEALHHPWLQ